MLGRTIITSFNVVIDVCLYLDEQSDEGGSRDTIKIHG